MTITTSEGGYPATGKRDTGAWPQPGPIHCGLCKEQIEPTFLEELANVHVAKAGSVCVACGTLMCPRYAGKSHSHREKLDELYLVATGKTLTQWREGPPKVNGQADY